MKLESISRIRSASAKGANLFAILLLVIYSPKLSLGDVQPVRSLAEIRKLELQGSERIPVDFVGTVTFADPVWNFFFVQRDANAIFVHSYPGPDLVVGEDVRVEGKLQAGDLSPVIRCDRVTRLHRGKEIVAESIDLAQEDWQDYDCRRVSLHCEVLQVTSFQKHVVFSGVSGGERIVVSVLNSELHENDFESMVGRRIMATGSVGLQMDRAFQFPGQRSPSAIRGLKLFCHSMRDVLVDGEQHLQGARNSTNELPTIGLNKLDQVSSRFRTYGQICMVEDSSPAKLFLLDQNRGWEFTCDSTWDLHVGMVVQVAGEKTTEGPDRGTLHAKAIKVLCQSDLKLSTAHSVHALDEMFADNGMQMTNTRVSVKGKPKQPVRSDNSEVVFQLAGEQSVVDVVLTGRARDVAETVTPDFVRLLKVTGIIQKAAAESDANAKIIVSSADDIEVLVSQVPPMRVLALAAVGCLIALTSALVWVKTLRVRVAEKTRASEEVTAQLRSSYEAVDAGILAVDMQQMTLAVNNEFRRLVDWNLEPGEAATGLQYFISTRVTEKEPFQTIWRQWQEDPCATSSIDLEFDTPTVAPGNPSSDTDSN